MEHTYIQIKKSTAISLKKLKIANKETYDEIILRLLKEVKNE